MLNLVLDLAPVLAPANRNYKQYIALSTKKFRRDLLIYILLEHITLFNTGRCDLPSSEKPVFNNANAAGL